MSEKTRVKRKGKLEGEVVWEEKFVIDPRIANDDLPIVYGHDGDKSDIGNGRYIERQIPMKDYDSIEEAIESGEYILEGNFRLIKKT